MGLEALDDPLEGGRCTGCGKFAYPRRLACRACGAPLAPALLSRRATLHSWTTVRVAPSGFEAPYTLGYAVMDDGPRLLVRIDEPQAELRMGSRLELARTERTLPGGGRSRGLEAVVVERSEAPANV